MKKYLVLETSVATDDNSNFKGVTLKSYSGKNGEVLLEGEIVGREWLLGYFALHYGYASEAQAKRNYSYRNPENNQNWQSTVKIIPVEV